MVFMLRNQNICLDLSLKQKRKWTKDFFVSLQEPEFLALISKED